MPRAIPLILAVFVASCLVGPALDQIHVIGGALSYADPWLLDQAWWVAPQFGLAFAAICAISFAAQLRFGSPPTPPVPSARIAVQVAWFVGAYLVTGAWWERPWLVVALLAVALVVRMAADRPDAATTRTIVLLALAGSLYEATLSSIPGTFDYAHTSGAPVPVWLPLLYAHGAPLLRSFTRTASARLAR